MRWLAVLVPAVLAMSGGVAQARFWGWYDVSESVLSCHVNGHDCSAFGPPVAGDVWHVTGRGRHTRRLESYARGEISQMRLVRHGAAWVADRHGHLSGCPSGRGRDISFRARIVVRESFGVVRGLVTAVAAAHCPGRPLVVTRSRAAIDGFRIYL
jgi:hypothetical protein